jgi:hypothetical protein
MNKTKGLIIICISSLLVFGLLGCKVLETAPKPVSTSAVEQVETVTPKVEYAEDVIFPTEEAKPSETATVLKTATPVPTFVMAPTPAPPTEDWLVYAYSDTGLSFQYPANWFVYWDDGTRINVTNFRLDGMVLKGYEDEKIKIDIAKAPIDISAYPSLAAYLESTEKETTNEAPGEVISQIELVHEVDGYEVIRQTHSGLMGQADQTYEKIYVASNGKLIQMVVFGKQYINVAERIASTLTFR